MPNFRTNCIVLSMPVRSRTSTAIVLRERASAVRAVMGPLYLLSAFLADHGVFCPGMWKTFGASSMMVVGVMIRASRAAP